MSVVLPSAGQQLPTNQPGQPSTTRPFSRWWYAVIAGALGALVAVLLIIFRRRRIDALPPPARMPFDAPPLDMPWTPPSRSTFTETGKLAASDSWLPTPDSQTPLAPAAPVLPAERVPAPAPTPVEKPRARTQYATAFGPPALLIGKSGPLAGKTFRLERADFWLGAAENNDLQLDDETVSGNHAFFRFEAETLKVFDNHSTNNTWVNRQPVGDTARILFPGDEIQIGRSVFIVKRAEDERLENVAQPGPPFALS